MKKEELSVKDEATEQAQELLLREKVRAEALKKKWDKYKYFVFSLVFLLIAGTGFLEYYKSYQIKLAEKESNTYEEAVILDAKGQTQEAFALLESLDKGKTNYRYLSKIRLAGFLLKQKKQAEAFTLLESVAFDMKAPEVLRSVAVFGLISQQIDSGDVAKLQALLKPFLNVKSPWYGTAVAYASLLDVRENKRQEALSRIDQALGEPTLPIQVKQNLEVMKKVFEL